MSRIRSLSLTGLATLCVMVSGLLLGAMPALAATAPVVESETTVSVTPFEARLEAVVNPQNVETTECRFFYGTTTAYGSETACEQGEVLGGEAQSVSVSLTGLKPGTPYHYKLVVENTEKGKAEGVGTFTTQVLEAPLIDGESATGVTHTGAELHALINPNYQETEYQFKLGTSTAYGVDMPSTPASLGGAGMFGDLEVPGVNVQAELEGQALEALKPNTVYHYETVATNGAGTTDGLTARGDETFLTLPEPPAAASTGDVLSLAPSSATVGGSVNPGSGGQHAQDDTTYYFEYGHTTTYGLRSLLGDAGEGAGVKTVEGILNGLEPGTTYHYRIVATNDNVNTEGGLPQSVYGEDKTLTTPETPPAISGVSAQDVTQSSAVITATLEPQELPTRWELQLGSTPGLLQPVTSGQASSTTPLSLSVGSLSSGTTYYYELTAINPNDAETPVSAKGSFTTAAAPAGSAPASLPALIPYQSIAELNAKEAKEDKGLPGPATTKSLTKAQKLKKALKACHAKKGKKRGECEAAAREKFGVAKKGKAKR
jgi:hypothetical protein